MVLSGAGSGLCSPGKARVRKLLEGRGDEEWESAGDPLLVTDAELKREFIEIGGLSADSKNPEWMKRVQALQKFRCLLEGGSHNSPNFLQMMRDYMKEPLNQAIQDLRSAVSREACYAVVYLCKFVAPTVWETMGDWFLNSLFKISVVTIAIISQSSSRCLRYIIKNGKVSRKMVQVCLDPSNFENKHSTYRQTVYQFMFTIIHKIGHLDLSNRELELLKRATKQGIIDPMPEVRRISRMMYWALFRIDQARAEELYAKLEQVIQKNIRDDEQLYEDVVSSKDGKEIDIDWEIYAKQSSMRRPSGHILKEDSTQRSSSARATPSHKRSATQRSTTPVPSDSKGRHRDTTTDNTIRRGSGSSPQLRRSSPRAVKTKKREAPKIDKISVVSTASTHSNARAPSIGSTEEGGISSEAPESFHHSENPPLPLDKILVMMISADPCDKIAALENVVGHVQPQGSSVVPVLSSIVSVLDDPNFMVYSCAATTCGSIAEVLQDSSHLVPFLNRIFTTLFTRLQDSNTHQTSVELLEKLLECGQTKTLIPILLKVLENSNPQVQLGALEYMLHLMNFSQMYLSRSSSMHQCVTKFAHVATTGNHDVRKAAVHCLSVLHGINATVFCEELLNLPSADLTNIKVLLTPVVPGLLEGLRYRKAHLPERERDLVEPQAPPEPIARSGIKPSPLKMLSADLFKNGTDSPQHIYVDRELPSVMQPAPPSEVLINSNPPTSKPDDKVRTAYSVRLPGRKQSSGRVTTPTVSRSLTHSDLATTAKRKALTPTASSSSRVAKINTGPWHVLGDLNATPQERISAMRRINNGDTPWPPGAQLTRFVKRSFTSTSLLDVFIDDSQPSELRALLIEITGKVLARMPRVESGPLLKDAIKAYLQSYKDPEPKISDGAEKALSTLVMEIDQKECVNIIGSELNKRGPASMLEEIPFLFKLLDSIITTINSRVLLSVYSGFIQALYDGFGSKRPEVRKSVVFCFVSLYLNLGSLAVDLLKPLNTSQLKLITIYVNKRQGKSGTGEVNLLQNNS